MFQILLNSQRVTSGLAVWSQCYSQVVWEQGYGLPTQCYNGTLISTADTLETKLDNILISEVSLFQEKKHTKLGLSQARCPSFVMPFKRSSTVLVFRFSAPPASLLATCQGGPAQLYLQLSVGLMFPLFVSPLLDITPVQ